MGEETRTLLEEEMKAEIKHLASLTPGSEEYNAVVESIIKLSKVILEADKNDIEWNETKTRRENDEESKRTQSKDAAKDRCVKIVIAGAELILPLIFYNNWMNKGFEFEKFGTYTCQTFRNLFNRFKPTLK